MVKGEINLGQNERMFSIIVLCTIIGIVIALALQLLYDQSIIIDDFLTSTITLREVQFGVVAIWGFFGIGVAALESR